MTLILRKLPASLTYAISGPLEDLANKLQFAETAAENVATAPDGLAEDFEEFSELADRTV